MKKLLLPFVLVALFNFTQLSTTDAMACDKEDYRPPEPITVLELTSDTTVCLAKGTSYRIISIEGKFFVDTPKINSDEDVQLILEKGTWIIAEKKWLRGSYI